MAFDAFERKFEGSFYYERTYSNDETPTPALCIDGYGQVALPLSPTEAKDIIAQRNQHQAGMSEQLVPDVDVQDALVINSPVVRIEDPNWDDFLVGALRDVCRGLGVDYWTSKPRCELDKLLVYETGSCSLPCRNAEAVDGMFASIVVVLPSPFSGGAFHLSNGEESVVFYPSSGSADKTSILAWYTGATYEVKPVVSGYRLALSYNVIHTTQHPRPSFVTSPYIAALFRHILLSWAQKEDATPFKIAYLLDYQYSQASLHRSALKGIDAHLVALLEDLARELGFRVALASVEYSMYGSGDYSQGSELEEGLLDDAAVAFEEIEEAALSIKEMVDLEGKPFPTRLDLSYEDEETIPANLAEAIQDGTAYEQTVERNDSNGEVTVYRWYHRTTLLLWPELHNVELEQTDGFSSILQKLAMSRSPTPSEEERRVTQYLVRAAASGRVSPSEVIHGVCPAAICWKDPRLWNRAVNASQRNEGLGFLEEADICNAVQHLGFENVQPTIESILRTEHRNIVRLGLLKALGGWRKDVIVGAVPEGWMIEQQGAVFDSLKKLRSPLEAQILLDIAQAQGVGSFLEDVIVPQVKALANTEFMLSFVCLLKAQLPTFPPTSDELAVSSGIVRELLHLAISKADFFERGSAPGEDQLLIHQRPSPKATPALAHLCFMACVKTGQEDLGRDVLVKLMAGLVPHQSDDQYSNPRTRTKDVLLAFLPLLAITLRAYPQMDSMPILKRFCQSTILTITEPNPGVLDLEEVAWCLSDIVWLVGRRFFLDEMIKPRLGTLSVPGKLRSRANLVSLLSQISTANVLGTSEAVRQILYEILKMVDGAES